MNYQVFLVRYYDDGYGPRTLERVDTYGEALRLARSYIGTPHPIGRVYIRDRTAFPHCKSTLIGHG